MPKFTSIEIEEILSKLNNLSLYQLAEQLDIKDEEIQAEVNRLLNDRNSKHKQNNQKRLMYLIRNYILKNIAIEDLIDFFMSLKNSVSSTLFSSMHLEVSSIIKQLEELEKSAHMDELVKFDTTYKTLDVFFKEAVLAKLIKNQNIKLLEWIWDSTENELKEKYIRDILNICNTKNKPVSFISFFEETFNNSILPDIELTTLAFETQKSYIKERELAFSKQTNTNAYKYFSTDLYRLTKFYLSLPDEQKQTFYQTFFSIADELISRNNLDYNTQIEQLLKILSHIDPIEFFELFGDKLTSTNEFSLQVYSITSDKINRLNKLAAQGFSLSVTIHIKSAANLSIEQLNSLHPNIKISQIEINDTNLTYWQKKPYTVPQYTQCRETIDDILKGIDLSRNPDDPNCEKKIFGKVIRRLAHRMTYDYELYKKIDDETINSDESFQCQTMYGALTVADTEGKGLSVCAGISETARNVFKCCGIDILVVSGDRKEITYVNGEKKEKLSGHQWNLIKLDGEWYWMDLTWAMNYIVLGQTPLYLLKSDADFRDHLEVYNEGTELQNMIKYPAPHSVPYSELHDLIFSYNDRNRQLHIISGKTTQPSIQHTIQDLGKYQKIPAVPSPSEEFEYGN